MGKNLPQQRRGKGTPTYRCPSHRFKGLPQHPFQSGKVVDLVDCPGHSAPLLALLQPDGEKILALAPQGIKVGDQIAVGEKEIKVGNVLPLKDIPEGTSVYNIESAPGDGGKFVRASGTFAKILAKTASSIIIKLPSRKERPFHPDCRAAVGVIAGSGRPEKPFLKAGTRFYQMRTHNYLYPKVCGVSKNAVDHPFGGRSSHHKGRPTIAPRNAPPGRKVGKLRPRRTGCTK